MKFYPPTDESVQVALTTGHVAIVEASGTELETRFQREAIAMGCMPEGVEREAPATGEGFDKMTTIINACIEMVEAGVRKEFTDNGMPEVRALSKRVGFTVSKTERDTAWEAVADETQPASDISDE